MWITNNYFEEFENFSVRQNDRNLADLPSGNGIGAANARGEAWEAQKSAKNDGNKIRKTCLRFWDIFGRKIFSLSLNTKKTIMLTVVLTWSNTADSLENFLSL